MSFWWKPFDHVVIGGVRVAVASRRDLVEAMIVDCEAARAGRNLKPRLIFDANGHGLSLRVRDHLFRSALDQGDVIHADGGFLIPASRLLTDASIPERSATTDMFHDAAEAAEKLGLSFFLLGGPDELTKRCVEILQVRYPK